MQRYTLGLKTDVEVDDPRSPLLAICIARTFSAVGPGIEIHLSQLDRESDTMAPPDVVRLQTQPHGE